MTTTTHPTSRSFDPQAGTLTDLGVAVDADGLAPHEAAVAALVRRGRAVGVKPVLLEVLGDRGAPAPARERALGRVLVRVAAATPFLVARREVAVAA